MKQTIATKIFSKILFIIFPILMIVGFGWLYNIKTDTQEDINNLKNDYTEKQKRIIKDHVDIVVNYTNTIKKLRYKRVKNRIKDSVTQAHNYMQNNYAKYHDKMSEDELKEMLTNSLRDVRFLDGRGYYFIADMQGVSAMHGKIKSLENKNNVKLKLKEAMDVHKKITELLSKTDRGFVEYNWVKSSNINDKPSKKIAYIMYFEPYDWYIGGGDYIEDIEELLKNDLLKIIGNIKFGKDGYIFVHTYDGINLLHVDKKIIGKNVNNLQDENGVHFVQELTKIARANKDGGYTQYIAHYRPETGKPASKIAFSKKIDDWKWIVGSGVYEESIDKILKQKEDRLNKEFILITVFLTVLFIIIGVYVFIVSKKFKKDIDKSFDKFKKYFARAAEDNVTLNVEDMEFSEFEVLAVHVNELVTKIKDLNQNLEQKVSIRTQELKISNDKLNKTLSKLQSTETKMIENEKMAALGELVAGVSHEINTPVGLSLTGITHFVHISEKLKKLYDSDNLSQEEFEQFIKSSNELADTITINLQRAADIIRSFKKVAVDQTSREKREFKIKEYIEEILLSLRNKIKKMQIDFEIECDETLMINSYPGALSQIITNLVMNSMIHGFEDSKKGAIKITIKEKNNQLNIEYSDDGKGISKESLGKIFEPFFTTKKSKGGSGLGLNIIQKIITDELHGTIYCKSIVGDGATFYITFPIKN